MYVEKALTMRHSMPLFTIIIVIIMTACSSTGNAVSEVTALPTITATIESDVINETITPSPQATTRLEATATAVSGNENRSTGDNTFQLATFTPSANLLEPGVARQIALATDIAMMPDIEDPIEFDQEVIPLIFSEFYSGFSIRTGLVISDKLNSLDGKTVTIEGYIAPPLRPRLDFFVLTRIQLAFCPFCSTDVEWPDDILLAYLPEQQLLSSEYPVRITGTLEVGSSVDAETGMVSLVRIYVDEMEPLN